MYETCLITANRQSGVCYLDRVLNTFGHHKLKVFSSNLSVENGFLDPYRDNSLIKIIEQDYLYMPKHVQMNFNYFRMLLHQKDCKEFLSIEDDIFFTKDWFAKLQRIREQIPHQSYLLSLYKMGNIDSNPETNPFIEVAGNDYSCSQGLLFVNLPIVEIMTYVYKFGVDKFTKPIDLLLGQWCKDNGIPILITNPSLVQHIGLVGNNISGFFHQSGSFQP